MRFLSKKSGIVISFSSFFKEVSEWLIFLYWYSRKRLTFGAVQFEKVKDILVDILITKRGRYSKHFLNISFLFLVAGAIVVGPVIGEYYPTVPRDTPYAPDSGSIDLASATSTDLSTTTLVSD